MSTKTKTYLNEAMICNAILIETVLNPSFWLSIFKLSFTDQYNYTLDLLKQIFETRKAKAKAGLTSSKEPVTLVVDKPKSSKQAQEEVD